MTSSQAVARPSSSRNSFSCPSSALPGGTNLEAYTYIHLAAITADRWSADFICINRHAAVAGSLAFSDKSLLDTGTGSPTGASWTLVLRLQMAYK